jgi:hypothetical protein
VFPSAPVSTLNHLRRLKPPLTVSCDTTILAGNGGFNRRRMPSAPASTPTERRGYNFSSSRLVATSLCRGAEGPRAPVSHAVPALTSEATFRGNLKRKFWGLATRDWGQKTQEIPTKNYEPRTARPTRQPLPAPCPCAPCSLLPAPCSLLPAPCSLLHAFHHEPFRNNRLL